MRINKINYGSFLKLYSSSYVFLNCDCLSACQLCHKTICFSFREQKRNMPLYICCLHKYRFTMCTLETINNILKNALRSVIYLQAIHSFIWHCMCVHACAVFMCREAKRQAGAKGNGVWRRPNIFCIQQLPLPNPHLGSQQSVGVRPEWQEVPAEKCCWIRALP